MSNKVITPTVGRKVWLRLNGHSVEGLTANDTFTPMDATVVYVWHDRMVNLAARITPADIEANIASEWYFTGSDGAYGAQLRGVPVEQQPPVPVGHPLTLLTFCILVLRNGFTVTGESACASPENFNAEIGRRIARENAVAKVWPLMGYALKNKLAEV